MNLLNVSNVFVYNLVIIVGIAFVLFFRRNIVRAATSKFKEKAGIFEGGSTGFMNMRGKTSEQKRILKYFQSTGILGAVFRISNETFDEILHNKIREQGAGISGRALMAHGMDADETKEIPPIYVGNYYAESQYFKMFQDHTFRASEYQMSYLMFSDKQMYAYSHIFDLTSANVTEHTKEYFYEDITSVDVVQKKIDLPCRRPLGYFFGGIAAIILGLMCMGIGMQIAAANYRTAARGMETASKSEHAAAQEMDAAREKERLAARAIADARRLERDAEASSETVGGAITAANKRNAAKRAMDAAREKEMDAAREIAAAEERQKEAAQVMAAARAKMTVAERGMPMTIGRLLGVIEIIGGLVIVLFLGYTRNVVNVLILQLTVPGNEFTCAMSLENMAAIQGMKAKIREKKVV